MSFADALALQPTWVGLWLNCLLFGAFILPLALLIWRPTRMAALLTLAAGIIAGISINWMYSRLGYVKLLGLPHIILWGPLVVYLITRMRREDIPKWPWRILFMIVATLLVSLAFDVVDVARYALGERTPMAGTP